MTVALAARLWTGTIGDEMVRLIATSAFGATLNICQFGSVERLADVDRLDRYLPAVFVKPESVNWNEQGVSGTEYEVDDIFRICYAYSISDATVTPINSSVAALDSIAQVLGADAKLTNIASTISIDQIDRQIPIDIEWDAVEDVFFQDKGIPVRISVLRWSVRWLARRTS